MACLFYKTRHICSCVSVHCRPDVRLLQRRPTPHFQKCAITTRKNGDIFNPAAKQIDRHGTKAWFKGVRCCLAVPCRVSRGLHGVTRTAGVISGAGSRSGGPDQVKPVLKVARLSENATIPTKASAKAAGYDLYSAYDYSIAPMEKAVVNTDIQIAVPPGCYGRLAPRSGLAVNHFIDVGAGVVDEDYRGNVGVVLFNFSKETFQVRKGERIAQLICERICHPDLEQCEALDETERGADGFGSTG